MRNFDIGSIDLSGSSDIDGYLSAETNEWAGEQTQNPILQRIEVASDPSFDLSALQMSDPTLTVPQKKEASYVPGTIGLDALFANEPALVRPTPNRRKVASISDIASFVRLSSDTLIHKSERDLWALRKDESGSHFIERLFDDNGEPLKG